MSVQLVNFLIDSLGLNSYAVDQIACIFEKHGIPSIEKEEIVSLQKLIHNIISLAEQKGGESVSSCMSIIKSIVLNTSLCKLEDCIIRILDFCKSIILNCPNWNSKNKAFIVLDHIFGQLKTLTNQFVRELLPRLKELVYFHLDLFKREAYVPLFPVILTSLSTLILSLNTSIKPIIPNIEPTLFSLMDNPNEAIRKKAVLAYVSLSCSDKTDDCWREMVKKTIVSLQITINEITGTLDSVLVTLPHLSLPSLSSFGRITPSFALSRIRILLHLLYTLFQIIPPTCSIPFHSVISVCLTVLELFVPKGRRNEEASADGTALSPKEQWLVYPLVYPAVFKLFNLLFERLKSLVLVSIQPITRSLRLFFLRFYKEYDISLIIAVYQTIECLIRAGGPSVLLFFGDLVKPTLSILRCMNTSQDKVMITAGEGKKQGKKNRAKRVYQVNKEENTAVLASEDFIWSKHPQVTDLYYACVQFVTTVIQKSRFLNEKDRMDIDVQLFICFTQLLSPSSPHHTQLPLHTHPTLRSAVTDAVIACCFSCLPSGQLSPLVTLIQPVLKLHTLYSVLSPAQVNSIQALSIMCHTPTQIGYRLNESELTVYVTTVKEEEKGESVRTSVKREIPIITKEPTQLAVEKIDTIPIQTGNETKKVELQSIQLDNKPKMEVDLVNKEEKTIESTMIQLRKLSHDFVEKERKKSMELETIPITPTTPGDDDFVFSDDGSFDVPDIPIYIVY